MSPRPSNTTSPVRPPEEVRREGNHLLGERSLYLRQHARNPVDWYPWGEAALRRARDEDKPIFLSIGYSSCHWCHVMEHETFEDDEVAVLLNAEVVAVKVDREERPDLDAVYMEAVQRMTGSGGWPLSAFLTPDGRPFFGGTYFPKEAFLALVRRIVEAYRAHRGDVERQAEALRAMVASGPEAAPAGRIDAALVDAAAARAAAAFDDRWGGFRGRMKFPTPLAWRTLLLHARRTGDERSAAMVRRTLDAMAVGGIHDHVGGGFHRYTVDATWTVPHFEKMLYDNALLARLYTEAAVALGEPRYAEVARATLDFLVRDMALSDGGFAASFDADSGGEEGSYYGWTPAALADVAGPEDGAALAALLGVTAAGHVDGRSVLTRRVAPADLAARLGREAADLEGLFARWRGPLREARARRVAPVRDDKLVTAWNGLAVAALADGYAAFGDARYRDAAERTAELLWQRHQRPDGGLFRVSNDGVAEHEAVLDDYALFAEGLLALHQATGARSAVERALSLLSHVGAHFRAPEGGYYLTADGHETPLGRQVELFDGAVPSGNSALLLVFLRSAALTGRADLRDEAERLLRGRVDLVRRAGMEMAGFLEAILLWMGPFVEVVVAGASGAADTEALVAAFRDLHPAHGVLVTVPADGPDRALAALLPATEGKVARDGRATGYVCRFGACGAPTFDPAELRVQILAGWHF